MQPTITMKFTQLYGLNRPL